MYTPSSSHGILSDILVKQTKQRLTAAAITSRHNSVLSAVVLSTVFMVVLFSSVLKIFSTFFPFHMVVLWLHLAVWRTHCLSADSLFRWRVTQLFGLSVWKGVIMSSSRDFMAVATEDTMDRQSQITSVLELIQSGDEGWVRALSIYEYLLRQSNILILHPSSIY